MHASRILSGTNNHTDSHLPNKAEDHSASCSRCKRTSLFATYVRIRTMFRSITVLMSGKYDDDTQEEQAKQPGNPKSRHSFVDLFLFCTASFFSYICTYARSGCLILPCVRRGDVYSRTTRSSYAPWQIVRMSHNDIVSRDMLTNLNRRVAQLPIAAV